MTYHSLSTDSGGDADSRRTEADKLIRIIKGLNQENLRANERTLLFNVRGNAPVSVKQLFFLRDIKDRMLDLE